MKKLKSWLKNNRKNIVIMLIYSIISFVILFFHESWKDEANAWLIARDLNFFELIAQMKYEGHFILWYLIIASFAKLGFPYFTLKIISWIIMNINVWLILKKAPFKYITKILLIFSSAFIYWYVAIPRVYCLIPLAIILIAISYKTRKQKPINYMLSILLLANTHIIMYGLVGVLLLEFFIETIIKWKKSKQIPKREIISFAVAVVAIFISILPLIGCLETNSMVEHRMKFLSMSWKAIVKTTEQVIIYCTDYIFLTIPLLIICIIYELRYYTKNMFMIIVSIAFQFAIYILIHPISEQRAVAIVFIILLFLWRQAETEIKDVKGKKIVLIVAIALLGLNVVSGICNYKLEICNDYSGAEKLAEYIKNNIEPESIILCNDVPSAVSVIPYLNENIKFYSLKKREYFTYISWDDDLYKDCDNEKVIDDFIKSSNGENNIYYLKIKIKEYEREEYENKGRQKIYESKDAIKNEQYVLYKLLKKYKNL